MKKVIICLVISILSAYSFSQNNDTLQQFSNFKHHSVYAELLGNSMYYSVNYDYLFRIYKNNIKLAVGTGIGYYPSSYLDSHGHTTSIEHRFYLTPETNFLFGGKSHYFETGTSLMIGVFGKVIELLPSARVGYRYQPQKGGFLFRVAYTPLFRGMGWLGYCWAGISLGYIF